MFILYFQRLLTHPSRQNDRAYYYNHHHHPLTSWPASPSWTPPVLPPSSRTRQSAPAPPRSSAR